MAEKAKDPKPRNTKYQSVYIESMRRYFFEYELDEKKRGIPQFSEFARTIDVTLRTLENWAKKYKAFGEAYEECRDKQQEMLINGGLAGQFNPKIVTFLMEARMAQEKKTGSTVVVVRHERAEEEGVADSEGAKYGG